VSKQAAEVVANWLQKKPEEWRYIAHISDLIRVPPHQTVLFFGKWKDMKLAQEHYECALARDLRTLFVDDKA
jgi:uncharacterized protein YigA (DUF484 family)